MLGWVSEDPGSILSAASSMCLFRKGDRLSEMVALLENSTRQKGNKSTAVKAYFSESACGRGASILMHCFSKVSARTSSGASPCDKLEYQGTEKSVPSANCLAFQFAGHWQFAQDANAHTGAAS